MVTGEFDNWKKIVNYLGKEGWIANSQLSKNRYGITNKEIFLRSFPKLESKSLLIIEKNVNFKISFVEKIGVKQISQVFQDGLEKRIFGEPLKKRHFKIYYLKPFTYSIHKLLNFGIKPFL